MKKRLIEFLAYLEIGQTRFEETVGLSRGYITNVGDSIREASLAKITAVYPELNINWLKTGEGEMLRPGTVERNTITAKGRGTAARTLNKGGVAGYVAGDLNHQGRDKTLEEVLREKDALIGELAAKLEDTAAKSFERNERNMERMDTLIAQQNSLIEVANLNTAATRQQMDRILSMLEKKM